MQGGTAHDSAAQSVVNRGVTRQHPAFTWLLLLLLQGTTCQEWRTANATVAVLGRATAEAVLCSTSRLPGCKRFHALYQQQQQRRRLHELGAGSPRQGLQDGQQQQGGHHHIQHDQHGSNSAAATTADAWPEAPCKRVLWFTALFSPELDKGYVENIKVAVLSARQNAPSLIPHVIVDGPPGGELETWLQRGGVQVGVCCCCCCAASCLIHSCLAQRSYEAKQLHLLQSWAVVHLLPPILR